MVYSRKRLKFYIIKWYLLTLLIRINGRVSLHVTPCDQRIVEAETVLHCQISARGEGALVPTGADAWILDS